MDGKTKLEEIPYFLSYDGIQSNTRCQVLQSRTRMQSAVKKTSILIEGGTQTKCTIQEAKQKQKSNSGNPNGVSKTTKYKINKQKTSQEHWHWRHEDQTGPKETSQKRTDKDKGNRRDYIRTQGRQGSLNTQGEHIRNQGRQSQGREPQGRWRQVKQDTREQEVKRREDNDFKIKQEIQNSAWNTRGITKVT